VIGSGFTERQAKVEEGSLENQEQMLRAELCRRNRRHKGRLLVEQKEAEVVRAIFTTYLEEQSIRHTTERIRALYEGQSPRLKRIRRSFEPTVTATKSK
jgi:hypothetical protein